MTFSVPCCALHDGARARRLVRNHLAFYLGSMGTFYRDSLTRQGYGSIADEVAAKWASGDREAAMGALSDDLVDALGAVGTPEHARHRLEQFESIDGVDAVSVSFPRGANLDEIDATLEAMAP